MYNSANPRHGGQTSTFLSSAAKAIDRLLKYNKILTASKTISCQAEYDIGVRC